MVITKDIWQKISEHLSVKDFLRLTEVSKFFFQLRDNATIWKKKFAKDFGFLPENNLDLRFKYCIAYFYKLGTEALILDESRAYHKKVVMLLADYKTKEKWMDYYLGKIYLYGWHGDYNKRQNGIEILKELSTNRYYPAFNDLINSIFNCSVSDPEELINLKDFVKEKLQEFIKLNNSNALRDLGLMYLKGIIYDKDVSKAIDAFQKAIQHGSKRAYIDLGIIYLNNDKVEDAVTNFKLAFDYGITQGAHLLGDYYNQKKDHNNAISWYSAALKKGDHEAGFKVGVIYFNLKKDSQLIENWFDNIYEKGSSKAAYFLGEIHQRTGKIETAKEWFAKGLKKGNDASAVSLGNLYTNNKSFDANKACEYYCLAYQLGNKEIVKDICGIYLKHFDDLDVKKIQKALYWLYLGKTAYPSIGQLIKNPHNKISAKCAVALRLLNIVDKVIDNNLDTAQAQIINLRDTTGLLEDLKKGILDIEQFNDEQRENLAKIFSLNLQPNNLQNCNSLKI